MISFKILCVVNEIYAYIDCNNRYEAIACTTVTSRLKTLSKKKNYEKFHMLFYKFYKFLAMIFKMMEILTG